MSETTLVFVVVVVVIFIAFTSINGLFNKMNYSRDTLCMASIISFR